MVYLFVLLARFAVESSGGTPDNFLVKGWNSYGASTSGRVVLEHGGESCSRRRCDSQVFHSGYRPSRPSRSNCFVAGKTVGPRDAQDEKEGRLLRCGKGVGQDAPGRRAEAPARRLVRVLRETIYRHDVGGERTRSSKGRGGGRREEVMRWKALLLDLSGRVELPTIISFFGAGAGCSRMRRLPQQRRAFIVRPPC